MRPVLHRAASSYSALQMFWSRAVRQVLLAPVRVLAQYLDQIVRQVLPV